jgi:VanZ family protein
MLRAPRQPLFWLCASITWFITLWLLSSRGSAPPGPEIPFSDKIAHFGFFFGGGGLLSAYLFCRNPTSPNWKLIILITVAILGLIGILDEFHQTFTPGRSGNDPFDWIADIFGATAGAFTFKRLHHLLR